MIKIFKSLSLYYKQEAGPTEDSLTETLWDWTSLHYEILIHKEDNIVKNRPMQQQIYKAAVLNHFNFLIYFVETKQQLRSLLRPYGAITYRKLTSVLFL